MSLHLNTIFRWCNDVEKMRQFYTECLGLNETYFKNDHEHGWLTYQLSEVQLVFTRSDEPLSESNLFAKNPAYRDGETHETSWVIEVEPVDFKPIVEKIKQNGYPIYNDGPYSNRPGHLQMIVRDPMGMTVELYTQTETKED